MEYLSKGKRGIVYLDKDAVVKVKREDSKATRALENEARWLKMLNKHNIGPRFIDFQDGKLRMEYIKGTPIAEWLKKNEKHKNKIAKDVLAQCRKMDKLEVNKLEMNHPYKHIIIRKGKAVMIDFERCKKTRKPKNVTQFCQYLIRLGFEADKKELEHLLKEYKRNYDEESFGLLLRLFCH